MIPSSHRGILLYVAGETPPSVVFDDDHDRVVTRTVRTLTDDDSDGDDDIPTADWTVIDAAALDTQPPPWFDALGGDVYVLAADRQAVPAWVKRAGVPVLDPTLVEFIADATPDGDPAAGRPSTDPFPSTESPADPSPAPDSNTSDTDDTADADDWPGRLDTLSAVPFPVALLDGDGVVRLVNDAWESADAGRGGPRFVDCGVGENYLTVCDDGSTQATAAVNTIQRVVDGGSDGGQIEYPSHGDGEQRWFTMFISPLDDAGPLRAAVIHQDISQYRQHINVLDRVLRHNLRNKANIILGHAAALASDRDDETATAATTIGAAARELLSLSEQARRYREVSVDDRATAPIDVVSVVTEVTERLSRAHARAVIETSLPGMAVVRASQSLSLVVHEVVENAIVHNDRAEPWVRVEVVRIHEGGDERVSIRVTDDGPGIPEEDRRLLTGGLEEHPIRHGSQLGVWVVSSLVTALGGTVVVEPRSPRGSVVTMTFPSASVDDRER
jgi:signal transduction histidine kinase